MKSALLEWIQGVYLPGMDVIFRVLTIFLIYYIGFKRWGASTGILAAAIYKNCKVAYESYKTRVYLWEE